MSFDQYERSNYDGKPVMLYEFRLDSAVWRYAGGMTPITVGGRDYEMTSITHEGYTMSGDPTSDDISIQMSALTDVAKLFGGTPPSGTLTIAIRTMHFGDSEAPVVWSGIVKSMKRKSTVEVVFNCNSLLSTLNRNGLRLGWQRGCPHALFDIACGVSLAAHTHSMQINSLTATTVTVTPTMTMNSDYFNGGFIMFVGEHGTIERRGIERNVGSRLELLGLSDGMSAGQWINVYAGCDRTSFQCHYKFNNIANYGGFPQMPNKSPFDGDPVF